MRYPAYKLAEEKLKVLLHIVSTEAKVTEEEILKRRGKVKISDARNLLCYVGMKSSLGSGNIGRFLDGRDHTTVMYNSKAFTGHIKTDVKLRILLYKVEAKLTA